MGFNILCVDKGVKYHIDVFICIVCVDIGRFSFDKGVTTENIIYSLIIVILSGSNLSCIVMKGSLIGENIPQFIVAPIVTVIDTIFIIGEVMFTSSSLIGSSGADINGDQVNIISIRVE